MNGDPVIGVDLGGTKLIAGLVDDQLRVHHRAQRPAPVADQASVLDAVVEAVEEVRSAGPYEVAAVGIGIPCLMDNRSGVAVTSVHLPLADVPFRTIMRERIGLPVFVDNDA